MRIRPGIIVVIVAIFAALFGARYLGFMGNRSTETPPAEAGAGANPGDTGEATTPSAGGASTSAGAKTFAPDPTRLPQVPTRTGPSPGAEAAAVPEGGVIKDWEQRIDDVLSGKEDENQKAKQLLDLFPNLPEDGQVEAAQHLSNLLPDDQFGSLAQSLTNAQTPEAVLEVLMTDVLNRPNAIKLPTLLDLARTPDHPKAEEARDVLEVFVDENFGTNWDAWQEALTKWLKENPDE